MKQRGTAYSVDLRQRVIATRKERGWTLKEAAAFFKIGIATLYRWERLERENGSIEPRAHGGGNPRSIDARGDRVLTKLVGEKPDRTRAELVKLVEAKTGCTTSTASVGRALRRLGITLKKRVSSR